MDAKILLPICSFFILSTVSPSIASTSEDESDVPRTSSPMPETPGVKDVLLCSSKLGWEMTLRTFLTENSKTAVTKKQLAALRKYIQELPDEKAYGQVLSQLGLALTVQDLSNRNGGTLLLSELLRCHYDKLIGLLNQQIHSVNTKILKRIVDHVTQASIGNSFAIQWSEGTSDELRELAMKSIEGLDLKSALQLIIKIVFENDQTKRDEQLGLLEKLAQEKDEEHGLKLQETSFKHLGLSVAAFYAADDLAMTCVNEEYYPRKAKVPPFLSLMCADEERIGILLAESIAIRNQDIMEGLSFNFKLGLDEVYQLSINVDGSSEEEECALKPPYSPPAGYISDIPVEPREMRESDLEEMVDESDDHCDLEDLRVN